MAADHISVLGEVLEALSGLTLTLCGTYTLDPVAEVLGYWLDYLGIQSGVQVAPYGQVFQQLLDPGSALRRNPAGANVVLIRCSDLGEQRQSAAVDAVGDASAEPIDEIASALQSFDHQVPCLVLVCPAGADRQAASGRAPGDQDMGADQAMHALQSRLASAHNVFVESGSRAMQRYAVARIDDPVAERFGDVPYTPEAMTALGTTVARWYAARVRAPLKLVAVDGDHTLWSGVVAEDGVDALRVEPEHAALQEALVRQTRAGRLLCLLSKNEEADVRAIFERREDMPLQWPHFVGSRIDWNPKPDNLANLVSELGLGLDSVVFLDDNPVECAQMRARCPAVATITVPTDPTRLAAFTDHLWLLDQATTTAEDANRTRMYRDDASRQQARRGSQSLQSFMDGLELVVEIDPPTPADAPRLAQLTQRTNQFNASLIRCNEREMRGDARDFHRLVRARDRFGDYGVVGQLRGRPRGDCLEVDLFMLSCRALGRGIEHRMLAAAGAQAIALGLAKVAVMFRPGERNAPVARFLADVFDSGQAEHEATGRGAVETGVLPTALPETSWFRMAAELAAVVAFDAAATAAGDERDVSADDRAPAPGGPGKSGESPSGTRPLNQAGQGNDAGALYEHIAHAMTTAADIRRAMARRVRPRPELAAGFVEPQAGHEREIARIWQQVLRIESIGIHDRFQDLGGKSIDLVQVHSLLLERLGAELDISALFQHPTVASLAAHLSPRDDASASATTSVTDAARQRALRMREARARANARHHRQATIGGSA